MWQEPDIISGKSFKEASSEAGYLYQILLTLPDLKGNDAAEDERMVRVRVQGAGELAGLDNGNLADVTPYTENSRKTWNGQLAVYVRRREAGSIRIECEVLGGRRYEVIVD